MPRNPIVIVILLCLAPCRLVLAQSDLTEKAEPVATEAAVKEKETIEEKSAGAGSEDYYELLMAFADAIDQIERNYVDKISRQELMKAAIEGALKKLDPYSNYIPPEDLDDFKLEVENEFGGIGIQIASRRNQLQVISPIVGTPAYRAGILAGDLILAINGTLTKGMSLPDAVKLLKGPAGSSLTLTVFHTLQGETEDVELTREVIKVETVLGDRRTDTDAWDFMYDATDKIAYLRITAFSRDTVSDLKQTLTSLTKEGMRALILDLRTNPGGLLKGAIEVSDLFLSSGTIVSTEGRNIRKQVWKATSEGTYEDLPLAVLINQYSASASEIVAAALQDHNRAVIVGQQSFGKASVQNVIELEEGRSALKLTTGSYQRPSGKPIHRFPNAEQWGVRPDGGFEVKLSRQQVVRLLMQRRERDIVRDRDEDEAAAVEDRQLNLAVKHLKRTLAESEP